ncbi:acyl-CoA reductase-like NAD-dependent aldehyde dehydrogenase [Paraburkholderia sp. BL18I3N2]|uniref:aldehyde dehydrogenase family protein n=1 Tax=unclassified Paraburkholderia TaxID=2615204 RepID=UPI000D049157|nr:MULTISPECIES: aldehyde dehydrogenase family protein [unclassified Paraburkholderia]PRX19197.1 acyl-CoA reductase-like NAD-dependent aldehyde dehydrogenase [Paraburkholderia sp. BL18I3N2]PRX89421.1 acyl-CoA reductase-like NAD-dependent aldehyde dehydrogenase [Paraburkholderia sp. BL25I1N1]
MSNLKFLIGGRLVDGARKSAVLNPATEEVVDVAPRASAEQINEAVQAAKTAFPAWSNTTIHERREVLLRIAKVVENNVTALAPLLTQEQGQPLAYTEGELRGFAGALRYAADSLTLPIKVLEDSADRYVRLLRRPLGVVAAIVPWNYPFDVLGAKLPAALLAGNTVVVKPAGTTPLTTLRLGELLADVVPPGVLNIVADDNDLGDVLTRHPDVRKVSFTGSIATGKRVMAAASESLKRVTLELGGNDPALVLEDADVAAAVEGIFFLGFINVGQACCGIKRVYVHASIYDAVCQGLAEKARAARLGNGLDPDTEFGPLQNRAQFERVKALLEDTRLHGNIIAGGRVRDGAGYFIEPTIVRDIEDGCRIVDEEQFGPILPVIRYTDLDDAIRRVNGTHFGLGASVWSKNAVRAGEIALRIDSGMVWVNKHADITFGTPFVGSGQSGIGAELGEEGLFEFTQIQVINEGSRAVQKG